MRVTVGAGSLVLALGCTAAHTPADHVAEAGTVRGFETAAAMHLFVPAADSCVHLAVEIGPASDGMFAELHVVSDAGAIGAAWHDTSCAELWAGLESETVGDLGSAPTDGWLRFQAEELSGELIFERGRTATITVRIELQRVLVL